MVKAREHYAELLNKHYSKDDLKNFGLKKITATGLKQGLTREDAVSILMLYGNAEGRNRLERNGISDITAMEIFSQLDEKDFQYAEDIWSYLDSYWSRISDLEKETKGKAPKKVEAESFKVGSRELKGGYFPITYQYEALQERLSAKGISRDALLGDKRMEGATGQTNDGHTEERVQDFDVQLDSSLSNPLRHLDQVVYDLHHLSLIHI